MTSANEVVFLLDIDNTLLDNDQIKTDVGDHLGHEFGEERRDRYREIFEALRIELGYTDFPFAGRLSPGALDDIAYLSRWRPTVMLTDGDVVFQPRKAQRSGLRDALKGRVLICLHKEQMLDDVEQRYPARHYVMVDNKQRILAAMKKIWVNCLTTRFHGQGRYELNPGNAAPINTSA